jgi:hydroxyethylthiazole kinase
MTAASDDAHHRKHTEGGTLMPRRDNDDWGTTCAELLTRIREQHPLIHHMTNYVVMNDTANVTLALGALPVMAHAREEVAEMVGAAGALVLNPGTLTPEWVDAMIVAGKRANELGVPIVYDPVGVGATKLRNETGARFLATLHLAVVRGNSGEVGALAGAGGVVKGVESVEGVRDPASVAKNLAQKYGTVVAITGQRDFISDGVRVMGVDNGHLLLKTVTGTGCMATTVVAMFCAVESHHLLAATAALACYGLAAEHAALRAKAPGSFRVALLDALYELAPAQVKTGVKIVELA